MNYSYKWIQEKIERINISETRVNEYTCYKMEITDIVEQLNTCKIRANEHKVVITNTLIEQTNKVKLQQVNTIDAGCIRCAYEYS